MRRDRAGSVRSRLPPAGGRRRSAQLPEVRVARSCLRPNLARRSPRRARDPRGRPSRRPPTGGRSSRCARRRSEPARSLEPAGRRDRPRTSCRSSSGPTPPASRPTVERSSSTPCSATPSRVRTRRSRPISTSSPSAACRARSPNGLAVPTRNLVPKPAQLSFVEAACLPIAYLTAYRMLFNRARPPAGPVRPRPGRRRRRVDGGDLARAGRRPRRLRDESERGEACSRARARCVGRVSAGRPTSAPSRCGARDSVGKATWDHSLKSLRTGGTVVVAGATSGPDPSADLARMFWRQLTVRGSSIGTSDELHRLCAFLEQTGVRPLVDSEFALSDARVAFARLDVRHRVREDRHHPVTRSRTKANRDARLGFVGLGNLGRHLAASLLGPGSRSR